MSFLFLEVEYFCLVISETFDFDFEEALEFKLCRSVNAVRDNRQRILTKIGRHAVKIKKLL